MAKTGNYELLYIVHPDLENSIDKVLSKVRSSIEERGGKITYEENWGKRKLAYEINKTDVGIYILWYFTAPAESVAKIEKELRLTEEIMRYLLLAYIEKTEKETSKKRELKAEKEKAETPKKKKEEIKKEVKKPEKKESEKERMEKIDEKLGELLGKEDNDKKGKGKETKK